MTRAELTTLLHQCRTHNESIDVTGALLYRQGTFMQVLEGQRTVVEALYAKVANDHRHTDVTFMIDGEAERQFGHWSMAFRDLTAGTGALADGFAEFTIDTSRTPAPNRATSLLRSFRRSLAAS